MLSVDYLVLPGLGDLTAGALLLVTLLCFAAVNSIPGCLLTQPLDHIKGCLSPGEDVGWSCGGTPHHQKSGLKHPCDCISRLDLDLGVTSTPCTASSCCWSGWLVPLATCSWDYLIPTSHLLQLPLANCGTETAVNESVPGVSMAGRGAEVSSIAQRLGKPTGRMRRPQPEDFVVMAPGLFPSAADSSWGGWYSPRQGSICCLG